MPLGANALPYHFSLLDDSPAIVVVSETFVSVSMIRTAVLSSGAKYKLKPARTPVDHLFPDGVVNPESVVVSAVLVEGSMMRTEVPECGAA